MRLRRGFVQGGGRGGGLRGLEPHVDVLLLAHGVDALRQLVVAHALWHLDQRLQLEQTRTRERRRLCVVCARAVRAVLCVVCVCVCVCVCVRFVFE